MVEPINELGLIPAERIELFEKRYYRQGSIQGPSVTTVLADTIGPKLDDWHARTAARKALAMRDAQPPPVLLTDKRIWERDIVNEAAGEGNRIALQHAAVGELFHDFMWSGEIDNDLVDILPHEFQAMLRRVMATWPQILETWDIFPVLTEFQMASESEGGFPFGGTLDALVETQNGHRIMLEVKTGRMISDTHAIQCGAYGYALRTMYGVTADEYYVIRIDKYSPGKWEYRRVNINEGMKLFERCLYLYNQQADAWDGVYE